MLNNIPYFCYMFRVLTHGEIELSGNELLIYTDIKKDYIKTSYKKEETGPEVPLKLKTYKIDMNDFIDTIIYSLEFPDEDDGVIYFSGVNDAGNQMFKVYLKFERKNSESKTSYSFAQLSKEEMGNDSFFFEASYACIRSGTENIIVIVISDNLTNKVKLDSILEFNQRNYILNLRMTCFYFLFKISQSKESLQNAPNQFKNYRSILDAFLYEIIFHVAYLYSLITTYEDFLGKFGRGLYDIEFFGINYLKNTILETVSAFYKERKFVYIEKLNKIFIKKDGDENDENYKMIVSYLKPLDMHLKSIFKFLKEKDSIEKKYFKRRDQLCLNLLIRSCKGRKKKVITNIKAYSRHLYKAKLLMHQFYIFYFVENNYIYNQPLISNNMNIEREIKYIENVSISDYLIAVMFFGFQIEEYKECRERLSGYIIPNSFDPLGICVSLNAYKEKINTLENFFKQIYGYSEGILEIISKDLQNELHFWGSVENANTAFTLLYLNRSKKN